MKLDRVLTPKLLVSLNTLRRARHRLATGACILTNRTKVQLTAKVYSFWINETAESSPPYIQLTASYDKAKGC
ncbi:hypothetical protein Q0590_29150 [Rhodocytophaga aerolata]|uniref:Uncharacterized protein n=1 Tax=Rhodocytophaga aerolata TaxID=455078 RepID=A0ABT8RE65_9BACT|nr:hypothetical protein [Rhodocytophaga aerolata]MDO1450378.1 hypothetical protein [Rhodocytophaga aerolata]